MKPSRSLHFVIAAVLAATALNSHAWKAGGGVEGGRVSARQADSVEALRRKAGAGDAESCYQLGVLYDHGEQVQQSYKEALRWYLKAAEKGHERAAFNAGYMYMNGEGTDVSIEDALYWYNRAAEAGLAVAEYNMASFYQQGIEGYLDSDPEKAAIWMQKSAEGGDVDAQLEYGVMLYNGVGIEQNLGGAFAMWKKAAAQGNASAMHNLGLCYEQGISVEPDIQTAIEYYRNAANGGSVNSMLRLGNFTMSGLHMEKDPVQAATYFRMAKDQGSEDGAYWLGKILLEGSSGKADPAQAYDLFVAAANAGNIPALHQVGTMLLKGNGVAKDEITGYSKLLQAANAGYPDSQVQVGLCYLNGIGVPKDKAEAVAWIRSAARGDSAEGLYWLARCYLEGTGVEPDRAAATEYLKRAAEMGHQPSIQLLADLQQGTARNSQTPTASAAPARKTAGTTCVVKVEEHGVSFECPCDWMRDASEESDVILRYVEHPDGLPKISLYRQKVDTAYTANELQKTILDIMMNGKSYNAPEIPKVMSFGDMEGVVVAWEAECEGVPCKRFSTHIPIGNIQFVLQVSCSSAAPEDIALCRKIAESLTMKEPTATGSVSDREDWKIIQATDGIAYARVPPAWENILEPGDEKILMVSLSKKGTIVLSVERKEVGKNVEIQAVLDSIQSNLSSGDQDVFLGPKIMQFETGIEGVVSGVSLPESYGEGAVVYSAAIPGPDCLYIVYASCYSSLGIMRELAYAAVLNVGFNTSRTAPESGSSKKAATSENMIRTATFTMEVPRGWVDMNEDADDAFEVFYGDPETRGLFYVQAIDEATDDLGAIADAIEGQLKEEYPFVSRQRANRFINDLPVDALMREYEGENEDTLMDTVLVVFSHGTHTYWFVGMFTHDERVKMRRPIMNALFSIRF